MKALYEVIIKVLGDTGGASVHTEILEFECIEQFDKFKANLEEYECIQGLQIWRSIILIN